MPSLNRPLLRELATVLVLKLVLLTALWWGFVRDGEVVVDSQSAASQMLGPPALAPFPTSQELRP